MRWGPVRELGGPHRPAMRSEVEVVLGKKDKKKCWEKLLKQNVDQLYGENVDEFF
jgi:hypothetical protein